MPRGRRTLIAFVALLASVASSSTALAQLGASADFTGKLNDALAKVAKYDFGGDSSALPALADLVATTYGKPAERKELAARLAEVLKSNVSYGAKDLVCRQLSIVGTASEVPALAGLLADAKLSHMARYALERIPGPEACEALRQTLGKVQGKVLIGVINSLGNRRSQGAMPDLAKLLDDADPAVARAAAAALGKIGPAACDTLLQALDRAPAKVRPAVAEACLLCADQLAGQGKAESAIGIYDRVRKIDLKAARVAATRGAVLARRAAGVPILVELLKGSDPDLFGVALVLAREMPGGEATKAAAGELGGLASDKQIRLIQALASRGDKAAMPAVLALAQGGEAKVRLAAILALARLGGTPIVPTLVDLAAGGEAELAQAAMASLASMPGKEIDAAVQAILDKPDAKLRRTAIEVLGQRRAAGATPALLKAAGDADESIRLAALKSLGDTAAAPDLAPFAELVAKAKAGRELAAAEAAVSAACARMSDRDACAQVLASAMPAAGAEAKLALLRTLGRVGGGKALDTVRAAIKGNDKGIRETALRVLADWSDPAATGDLAALARSAANRTHKILALRGYIRLIGQGNQPPDQKLALCKDALALADRNEEKKLVLGALGGVPTAEALAMVSPFLDAAGMKDEAAAAAVAIGEKIAGSHKAEVARAMSKVLKATQNAGLTKRAKELLDRTSR